MSKGDEQNGKKENQSAEKNPQHGAEEFGMDQGSDFCWQSKHQVSFVSQKIFVKPRYDQDHGHDHEAHETQAKNCR